MLNPEFTFSPTWWRLSRLGKEPSVIRLAALDFFCDYIAYEAKMTVNEALTLLGQPVLEALIANETLVLDGENIRIPYLDSQKKTKIERIRFILDNNKDISNYISLRGRDKEGRDNRGGVGEKEGEEGKEKGRVFERARRNSIYSHEQMTEMFEGFWNFYDKKVGKDKAMVAWFKLTDEEVEKIRNTLPAYLEAFYERKYRKDPVRYLTHKAFNDEPLNASERHTQNKPLKQTDESLRNYTPEPGIVR